MYLHIVVWRFDSIWRELTPAFLKRFPHFPILTGESVFKGVAMTHKQIYIRISNFTVKTRACLCTSSHLITPHLNVKLCLRVTFYQKKRPKTHGQSKHCTPLERCPMAGNFEKKRAIFQTFSLHEHFVTPPLKRPMIDTVIAMAITPKARRKKNTTNGHKHCKSSLSTTTLFESI